MKIASMRIRITFQKHQVVTDEIGNHTNAWVDYFSCYATAVEKEGGEKEVAGQMVVEEKMDFTVRYSTETANIVPDQFRILCKGRIYNIRSISDMAFKNKSLKIHAQLERR